MRTKGAEIIATPEVVSAIVTGVGLELEESLRIILMRPLSQRVFGRVQFRRRLRHQHRFRIRHFLLRKQLRLRLYPMTIMTQESQYNILKVTIINKKVSSQNKYIIKKCFLNLKVGTTLFFFFKPKFV